MYGVGHSRLLYRPVTALSLAVFPSVLRDVASHVAGQPSRGTCAKRNSVRRYDHLFAEPLRGFLNDRAFWRSQHHYLSSTPPFKADAEATQDSPSFKASKTRGGSERSMRLMLQEATLY